MRTGQATTGRVIIAAATIMILVFGAFILSGQQVVGEIGLGMAAAVLLDAFLLRTLLVPALMHLSARELVAAQLARPRAPAPVHRTSHPASRADGSATGSHHGSTLMTSVSTDQGRRAAACRRDLTPAVQQNQVLLPERPWWHVPGNL